MVKPGIYEKLSDVEGVSAFRRFGPLIWFLASWVLLIVLIWLLRVVFWVALSPNTLLEQTGDKFHLFQLVLLPWPIVLYQVAFFMSQCLAASLKGGFNRLHNPKEEGLTKSLKKWGDYADWGAVAIFLFLLAIPPASGREWVYTIGPFILLISARSIGYFLGVSQGFRHEFPSKIADGLEC